MKLKFALLCAAAAAALAAPAVQAKPFKWSSASDIPTLDIHSQNNALGNGVHAAIYDSLVYYNSKTFKPEPQLATSWKLITPTQMRFSCAAASSSATARRSRRMTWCIRSSARWPRPRTTASTRRASTEWSRSMTAPSTSCIKGANPVLLNQLTELRIMSKAWAEKNNSRRAQGHQDQGRNLRAPQRRWAPGPFMVKEWQPDQKLVLVNNPNYWGKHPTNVDRDRLHADQVADATRLAALLSGETDFVLDPSPQDLARLRNSPNSRSSMASRTAPSSSAWTSSATNCRARA